MAKGKQKQEWTAEPHYTQGEDWTPVTSDLINVLNDKHYALIEIELDPYLSNLTNRERAELAGYSECYYYKLMKDPVFLAALNKGIEGRRERIYAKAIRALERNLGPGAKHNDIDLALKWLDKHAPQRIEVTDLRERISTIQSDRFSAIDRARAKDPNSN